MNFDDILRGLLYGQMAVGILLVLALLCHMLLIAAYKLQRAWLRFRFGSMAYRDLLRFLHSQEGEEKFKNKWANSKEGKAVAKQEAL